MLSWLKRKFCRMAEETPDLEPLRSGMNPANPGIAATMKWAFNDGRRTWEESMDLVDSLVLTLREHGRRVEVGDGIVADLDSGISLRPLLVSLTPVHEEGVKTTTTIEIMHGYEIKEPIFEFQHSSGADIRSSVAAGFEQWFEIDFVVLRDAVADYPNECLELTVPVTLNGREQKANHAWSRASLPGIAPHHRIA